MSISSSISSRSRRAWIVTTLGTWVVAGLLTGGGGRATAAPIRGLAARHQVVTTTALSRREAARDAFFTHALQVHSLSVPRFPFPMSWIVQADGRLASNPMVDYLLWRRSLSPARFDRYHPLIGPLLTSTRVTQTTVPFVPPVPVPPIRPTGEGITPPNVPEPPTLLIAAVMVGAAAWARKRRKELAPA